MCIYHHNGNKGLSPHVLGILISQSRCFWVVGFAVIICVVVQCVELGIVRETGVYVSLCTHITIVK